MARRLGVSREDVIAAAVRVGDRAGLDGLTVAAVAAEVGCRPPSVYHHVDGLDGLVRAVTLVAAIHLTDHLEEVARDTDGRQRLRALLHGAHRWGVQHPARFDALRRPVDPDVDPELAAARAAVLLPVQDALVKLGVPAEHRAPLLAALVAAVRGCIAADIDAWAAHAGAANAGDGHNREARDRDGRDKDGHDGDGQDGDGRDGAGRDGARTAGHELLVGLLLDHVDAIRPAVAP